MVQDQINRKTIMIVSKLNPQYATEYGEELWKLEY